MIMIANTLWHFWLETCENTMFKGNFLAAGEASPSKFATPYYYIIGFVQKLQKCISKQSKLIYLLTVLFIWWFKLTTRNSWNYHKDPYQTVLNPILYSEECVCRLRLPSSSIEFLIWLKGLIQLWWLLKAVVTRRLFSMNYSSPTIRETKMFFLWLGIVSPYTSNDAYNIWLVACLPFHAQSTDVPTRIEAARLPLFHEKFASPAMMKHMLAIAIPVTKKINARQWLVRPPVQYLATVYKACDQTLCHLHSILQPIYWLQKL